MWCIPPKQDAAFVAAMEQVLTVYQRPYDPLFPVVNMDEQPIQLVSHSRAPLPMRSGSIAKVDYEYVREGMCNAFMFVEPLGGWREVHVSKTKTALDWASYVKWLVDHPRYSGAERITLVCDNLNTHCPGSLYRAFAPDEAFRLLSKLEMVFTPKHGSWLNMAEPELSVMTRQCFSDRVGNQADAEHRITAWYKARNVQQTGINWRFTTDDARIKLKRLYPKIELR
jgi:hypothetical protein